jgi:hypothetical protein
VFASPQSVAAAVAFEGERLSILRAAFELSRQGDGQIMPALAGARRAVELDRYGLAAHVLAVRDGCTIAQCAALSMFDDATALKANLKAQAFETYVARYAPQWGKPVEPTPPVAAAPNPEPAPAVAALAPPEPPHDKQGTARPVDKKWTFPSADSIPAISIMKPEPPLPKGAALPEPKVDAAAAEAVAKSEAEAKAAAAANSEVAPESPTRLPPKRPQGEAAPDGEPR